MKPTILFPVWSESKSEYLWPGLEIRSDTKKGKAVFATKRLLKGTLIPYLGNHVSQKWITRLKNIYEKNADVTKQHGAEFIKRRFQYLMKLNKFFLVDGYATNPFEEKLFIASFFNEPSIRERANCSMKCLLNKDIHCNFIMTTKLILPDEELTFFYGEQFDREYKIGSWAVETKDFITLRKKRVLQDLKKLIHFAHHQASHSRFIELSRLHV